MAPPAGSPMALGKSSPSTDRDGACFPGGPGEHAWLRQTGRITILRSCGANRPGRSTPLDPWVMTLTVGMAPGTASLGMTTQAGSDAAVKQAILSDVTGCGVRTIKKSINLTPRELASSILFSIRLSSMDS
jgi:hypothetical protein